MMKRAFILVILSIFIALFLLPQQSLAQTSGISSITLSQGWNFISLPKQPPSTSINDVLKDISVNVRVVWGYDNQNKVWLMWRPHSAGNTLTEIIPGSGYWIYMNAAGAIDMMAWVAATSHVNIYAGWNLIGYLGENGLPAPTALAGIVDKWALIWTWENGVWTAESQTDSDLPVEPLQRLQQGKAYWVKAAEPADMGWGVIPPEARSAANALLTSVNVPQTSRVLFAGPVEAGTILRESNVPGEQAQIQIPDTVGQYYVFFIDDEPQSKFYHPVRFAWVNAGTGDAGFISAGNRMTIYRPGKTLNPFKQIGVETIGSVQFSFMEGEGAPELADISNKPILNPETQPLAQNQEVQTESVRSPMEIKQEKLALVIDAGDSRGWYSFAADMYIEAEGLATWLKEKNFFVYRISQYWKTPYWYVPTRPSGTRQDLDLSKLIAQFRWFVDYLSSKGPASNGVCDEFFIYIGAHGSPEGARAAKFSMYPADGADNPSVIDMMSIFDVLKTLPYHVKVTVFLDACYSGQMFIKNARRYGGTFMEQFCPNHCGLTVMSSASATTTAPATTFFGGQSSTKQFMNGAILDNDGDGKIGTIKDRWMEMRKGTASTANPPYPFVCPGQESWCSLHVGPTTIPPPPARVLSIEITSPTYQDTYTTSNPTVDLAGTLIGADFTSVTWKSSKGDSGNAQDNTQGTGNWSIKGIALDPGENTIIVTVTAGTVSISDTIRVVYNAPKVSITTPTNTGTFTAFGQGNFIFSVGGVITGPSDNISSITWENSLGGSGAISAGAVWSPFQIQLQQGDNVITVKARDKAGSVVSEDQITVTSMLQPSVSIVSPAKDPKPVTDKSPITISGTAYDLYNRIKKIVCINNKFSNFAAAGTTTWEASVTLRSGDNSIQAIALDKNNFTLASDTIIVTYNPPPATLTITSPTNQDTYQTYKGTVDLAGTTENIPSSGFGNSRVAKWTVKNGDIQWEGESPMLSNDWSITGIALLPGANLITVGVMEYGYITPNPTDTITVVYEPPPATLTITSPTDQDTYATDQAIIDLAGTTANIPSSGFGNSRVAKWTVKNGDYQQTGESPMPSSDWSITGITLKPGANLITVGVMEYGYITPNPTDTVTVTYNPPTEPMIQLWFGGTGDNDVNGACIGPSGGVYAVGTTKVQLGPVSGPSPQATDSSYNAYVRKFDSNLNSPNVVYLGGTGEERGNAVAMDASGNVYITGSTTSNAFPGASNTYSGSTDAFLAKLSPDLTQVLGVVYFGGSSNDMGYAVRADGAGNIYIAGETASATLPGNVSCPANSGGNAFVAKFDSSLNLLGATCFGGTGTDSAKSIAIDGSDNIYISGNTTSPDFPLSAGGAQQTFGGLGQKYIYPDGFIAKLSPLLTLVQSTYFGGTGQEFIPSIMVSPEGSVYAAGWTSGLPDSYTNGGAKTAFGGYIDGFVAKFNSSLTVLERATYLGGSGATWDGDGATALALHPTNGDLYVAGWTDSTDLTWTAGSTQQFHATDNASDGFVCRISPDLTTIGRCTYAGGAKTGYINEYPMAMVITSGDPVGTVWLFGRGNDWSNGSYTNDGFVITMSDSLQ